MQTNIIFSTEYSFHSWPWKKINNSYQPLDGSDTQTKSAKVKIKIKWIRGLACEDGKLCSLANLEKNLCRCMEIKNIIIFIMLSYCTSLEFVLSTEKFGQIILTERHPVTQIIVGRFSQDINCNSHLWPKYFHDIAQ